MLAQEIYHAALAADVLLHLKDGVLAYKAAQGMPDDLKRLIGLHKEQIIEHLRGVEAKAGERPPVLRPLRPLVDRSVLPVSSAQRRVWLADRLSGDGSRFNIQGCFEFSGMLNSAAFRHAIDHLLRRHEVLRTNFFEVSGELCARAQEREGATLTVVDLSTMADPMQAQAVRRIIEEDLRERFDLSHDALFKIKLLRLSDDKHVVVFNMHHIVSDGWSVGILIEEFCRAYAASCANHAIDDEPPLLQYADYAAWQDAQLNGETLRSGLAFWKTSLEGAPEVHSLPIDKPRPAQQSFDGDVHRCAIGRELAQRIREYCQDRKVTLFMFLETALSVLLGLYSGETDVVVGTPVAGRTIPEVEPLVGLFVNTVVIRNRLDASLSFDSLLQENKRQILAGFAQQHVPFELLVEELDHRRSSSYSPVFQIWFVLQNNKAVQFELPACRVREYADIPLPAAKYDLNLYAKELNGEVQLEWVFNRDIFDARSIRYAAEEFLRLLGKIVQAPQNGCLSYDVFSAQAVSPAPAAVSDSVEEIARDGDGLLRRIAERTGEQARATAVVTDSASYTYGELNHLSGQYVAAIQRTETSARVGLLLKRGIDVVAAMLAALKLRRTYVTLDPSYPQARLKYMVEHSGCDLLISDEEHRELAQGIASGVQVLAGPEEQAVSGSVSVDPADTNAPAYILYTSGSTGHPKGVFQSHPNLAYHAESYVAGLGLSPADKILQLASYSFDASVLDTYGALLAGASVHLADPKATTRERLLQRIEEWGITVYHSTPTVFKYLFSAAEPKAVAGIRMVVLGGEAVDPQTTKTFRNIFGAHCRLISLYGATESSLTTLNQLTREHIDAGLPTNLGYPINGTEIVVRRSDGARARVFEPGQIAIKSRHLADGYWNDPELTSQRFRPVAAGAREYLTGDAGYVLPDGSLRFVGRLDFQVKLNGIRIELGEIESTLLQIADVSQAVVTISGAGDDDQDPRLVAYVTSKSANAAGPMASRPHEHLIEQYRTYLRQWLPDYMVPGAFVFMDSLPQTPSGKVDRRRLPEASEGGRRDTAVPPRDETERRLGELWMRVLKLQSVGVKDDFFLLGGHSLKAMRLCAAIQEEFGIEIPLKTFFERPSIEGCAELLRNGGAGASSPLALFGVDRHEQDRYEPFPLTLIQQAYWLGRSDIFELGSVSTQSYIEASVQDLCVARLSSAFSKLIARHEMLRAVITEAGEQRILEEVPQYRIEVMDLRGHSEQDIASITERLRDEMSTQVLSTDVWPIFDFRVSLLPGGVGRLHIVTEAITLDARSRARLANELSALYADPERQLSPLGLSFRDYVLAEQKIRNTPAYASSRAYWLGRLDSLPGAPDLPRAASAAQSAPPVRRWQLELNRDDWDSLKAKSARHQLTPANVVLTAFAEVLAYWGRSGHFCLNLTLFNRHPVHEHVNDIVGDFTSSILLEVDLDAERDFARRAKRIQDQLWTDIEHRHFSGVEVLRELNVRRATPLAAQMPVVFTSTIGLSDDVESDASDALFVISDTPGRSRTSQVLLDCQVAERNGGASIVWNGVDSLFPQHMLDDMFCAFRARVIEIGDSDMRSLPQTQIALPERHAAVRAAVNETGVARPDVLLHELVAARVATHANKTAVAWQGGALTYAELDRLSNALAHRLRDQGVRVNQLVGVVAQKGWEQIVSVLAVLKAGAAYLPIDPELPLQRRDQLLEQADVRVVLTQPLLDEKLEWPAGVVRLCVARDELNAGNVSALAAVQTQSDLAYVIFTSGSTGVPKGVMIDHRGAVNTVLDINRRYAVTDDDVVLALSALNFDLSVYDIFGLLAVGGAIVVPEAAYERDPLEWTRLVETYGVTLWNSVPALARMWVESWNQVKPATTIRVVMMSGDWIPTDLPDRLRRRCPGAQLHSLGGATEASIWSIVYPIGHVDPSWSSIPYGKPMENQSFRVMKRDLRDCPEWVSGDLYIGGVGLAKGYWKDAEKTAASFVTHPLSGERLYKTGDVGRYLSDGNIEFLGREDNQVKINGYRIELGDIETAILGHAQISTAIVAAVGERNRKQLVAYVQLQDAAKQAELRNDRSALDALSGEVQGLLRERLPAYMMPAAFVLLDAVPLTANGKVNRNALPTPELARAATKEYRAATNPVESSLCDMWQQLLGLRRVGTEDNFFEIGGDSLLASRAVGLIRTRYGLEEHFKIRSFFEAPTVGAIAAQVSTLLAKRSLNETLRSLPDEAELEEGLI